MSSVYMYVLTSWRCVHTFTWCGLGLAGNVNSVIGGMYLGITCGLTHTQGIMGFLEGFITDG